MNKKRVIFGTLSVMGFYIVWFVLPQLIIEVKHPIIRSANYARGTNKMNRKKLHPNETLISRTSTDGLIIKASYVKSKKAKKNMLLIHGIRSSKADFQLIAARLLDSGYNIMAIDLRAHGLSQGKYCTFGAKEKEDISMFVDFLKKENNLPIGIWGRSLGGSVALQSMATDKRIAFGIIESTFSSFDRICKDYFERYVGFRLDPLVDFAIWRTGQIAQFHSEVERPKESCKRITQNVLLAHGKDDSFISISHGRENFKALSTDNKEFISVPNAGHGDLWQKGGEAYFKKVFSFISSS